MLRSCCLLLLVLLFYGCKSPDLIYDSQGDLTVEGGYHADWEPNR